MGDTGKCPGIAIQALIRDGGYLPCLVATCDHNDREDCAAVASSWDLLGTLTRIYEMAERPGCSSPNARGLTEDLQTLVDSVELLEVGRKAIEDALLEWRDRRLSTMRNNGFVIKEPDGTPSHIIRFGPEDGLRIALKAIIDRLIGVTR